MTPQTIQLLTLVLYLVMCFGAAGGVAMLFYCLRFVGVVDACQEEIKEV